MPRKMPQVFIFHPIRVTCTINMAHIMEASLRLLAYFMFTVSLTVISPEVTQHAFELFEKVLMDQSILI